METVQTNRILDLGISKVVVYDIEQKKEIAVITHDLVTTAESQIVVRVTPVYSEEENETIYENTSGN